MCVCVCVVCAHGRAYKAKYISACLDSCFDLFILENSGDVLFKEHANILFNKAMHQYLRAV